MNGDGYNHRGSEFGHLDERFSTIAAAFREAHAEEVREERRGVVERHLLVAQRRREQDGPQDVSPAHDGGDGVGGETEGPVVVLEVSVVDEDGGGGEEDERGGPGHPVGVAAAFLAVEGPDEGDRRRERRSRRSRAGSRRPRACGSRR